MNKILNQKIIEKTNKLNESKEKLKELNKDPILNKENIEAIKGLIFLLEKNIEELKNPKKREPFNKYKYFKPEYREGGYFQSKDFEEKCNIFDEFIKKNNMNICTEDYGKALQIFLKENFDIDWEWDENKRLLDEYKDKIIIVH